MQRNAAKLWRGQQRIQRNVLFMPNKLAISFKHLRSTACFTFQGIACDMRRADIHFFQQFHVEFRFAFPDIQHYA